MRHMSHMNVLTLFMFLLQIVHAPFIQMMSIHSFVEKKGEKKQFPLAFALMSRRTKADYVAVLQALKTALVTTAVEMVMLDFERGKFTKL
jgi:hypothetical protein